MDSGKRQRASRRAPSDAQLVADALCGSAKAFGELVRRYRSLAYATALHYLGRADDAQDAAQEALIQTFTHLGDLRQPERFQPWLYRATVNRCLEVLRCRKPAARGECGVTVFAAGDVAEDTALRISVRDALDRLPEKLRLTITLCYLHGRSHEEVARYLDLPLATVRSRLQHAKRQLRKEMGHMVEQSIKEAKPAGAWSRKVVREVLRRADEARRGCSRGEALRLYDEALGSLQKGRITKEKNALALQALFEKQSLFAGASAEKAGLLEEALELARQTGDRQAEARALFNLAGAQQEVSASAYYRDALSIYQELGDTEGQGNCLLFLGGTLIMNGQSEEGRLASEQALPLLRNAGSTELLGVCESVLKMLGATGDRPVADFTLWSALCTSVDQTQETISLAGQPGFTFTRSSDTFPYPTLLGNVFYHAGFIQPFLDSSVPVGGSWSGAVWSYSEQPLNGSLTILSDSETIDTPAGRFEKCLMTELTIAVGEVEDRGTVQQMELNRIFQCGRPRAWYAPNVGLVQIEAETEAGGRVASQLAEYHVAAGQSVYLPLAIGNTWTYRTNDLPEGFEAVERCRVIGSEASRWYLSHYAYALEA